MNSKRRCYDTVWCLIMFDLPVQTKQQRREATRFRKLLLDNGFSMIQYSVYGRYSPTVHSSQVTEKFIKDNLPHRGEVRILHLTDNQWATATRFISRKKTKSEERAEEVIIV